MLSLETLRFLHELLSRQTLAVGAPDFRPTAALVGAALDELEAAISATGGEST